MKIAILGAGFSGLACCWHLLQEAAKQKCSIEITLFDPNGIGGGASGASSGLLHPYTGPQAKKSQEGDAGMAATCALLDIAEAAIKRPVALRAGILRPAINATQEEIFAAISKGSDALEYWDVEKCTQAIPGIISLPGLFIKNGITVYPLTYLQGLWQACLKQGVPTTLRLEKVSSLNSLGAFNRIVVAAGAEVTLFPEFAAEKITPIKGQAVELAWPKGLEPLPFSIVSDKYITMSEDLASCIAGATYERIFTTTAPTPDIAIPELLAKIETLFPPLKGAKILNYRAGLRASCLTKPMPLLKQIGERCWLITGMGSKGLLYHALFAKRLSQEVLKPGQL